MKSVKNIQKIHQMPTGSTYAYGLVSSREESYRPTGRLLYVKFLYNSF